jgi:hypothetical protein
MLQRPRWIDFGGADRQPLRYLWDDARVDEDFAGDAEAVLEAADSLSVRARMALAVGLYEWVLWRYEGLHTHEEPLQILQAAWCATVDPRYLLFFELTREDWPGPVAGPLWCAFTYLQHGLANGHADADALDEAIEFLVLLAVHVLPAPAPLQHWLQQVLQRLAREFPPLPEDPFSDLFEQRVGEQLGPLVGRDRLDPQASGDAGQDLHFLEQVLQQAQAADNPFMATPDDLEELGFEGVPYDLQPFRATA